LDAAVLAVAALWMRWKGDRRLERRLRGVWDSVRKWAEGWLRRIGMARVLTER
jgi:hypothetical protein